ncbi:hypothetical protein QJS66_06910 [Kocuria rhizophila]|nr:hypothetical protein QJS66_06910 [Kocuria rhizophila]
MNDPQLLLVDEPTAALDQERSRAIMELLANLTHQFRLGLPGWSRTTPSSCRSRTAA